MYVITVLILGFFQISFEFYEIGFPSAAAEWRSSAAWIFSILPNPITLKTILPIQALKHAFQRLRPWSISSQAKERNTFRFIIRGLLSFFILTANCY